VNESTFPGIFLDCFGTSQDITIPGTQKTFKATAVAIYPKKDGDKFTWTFYWGNENGVENIDGTDLPAYTPCRELPLETYSYYKVLQVWEKVAYKK
jgi:hypothetical protein